ncbi:LIM domain-containing protein [Streptomyces turgidiscabies]
MGGTVRCARCGKGISDREKWVVIREEVYHKKCAERIEKGKQ